jgi:hypothetical protein
MIRSLLTISGISVLVVGLCVIASAGPVDYQTSAGALKPGVGASAEAGSVNLKLSEPTLSLSSGRQITDPAANNENELKAISHVLSASHSSGHGSGSGSGSGSGTGTGSASKKPRAPVPEPATLILLGTGLSGVAASLRRRSRKA